VANINGILISTYSGAIKEGFNLPGPPRPEIGEIGKWTASTLHGNQMTYSMVRKNAEIEAAVAAARAVVASRYPEAKFAVVAGSIIRGEGTVLSDIDLVVLYDHVEAARRESFVVEGFPVEAFVHDAETLRWFMDQDVERGRPSIVNMVAEGRVIGPRPDCAEALKTEAAKRLADGPPSLSGEALNSLRYAITDLVDDLRGERTPQEMLAIGANLYQALADLALLGRGQWTGSGKWIPRLLAQLDEDVGHRFDDAFRYLFVAGQAGLLIALANAELARHGGPLFDGDRREAPVTARRSA